MTLILELERNELHKDFGKTDHEDFEESDTNTNNYFRYDLYRTTAPKGLGFRVIKELQRLCIIQF